MKISLDINAQRGLHAAFGALDGYQKIVPGVDNGPKTIRVPYVLGGAARRVIVKNLGALTASLNSYDQARQALVKEIWPDLPDGTEITAQSDPVNFPRYAIGHAAIVAAKDELELLPLPETLLFGEQEFPTFALALLNEHGLISEAAAS